MLFFFTQIIGLMAVEMYGLDNTLPLNIERPEMQEQTSSISLFVFILIATVLALLLIKFKMFKFWRMWFLLSVFFTLTVTLNAFVAEYIAVILAIIFAIWKIFKPNVYVHNLTELFIYGALAVIFVPLLSIWGVILLLVLISVYDYIAVRKTKHMIKLAKSQSESKVFAGLVVPYGKNVAILGGGDIGFPLLFAAVVMVQFGLTAFDWRSYIIPLFTVLMLFVLFMKGEKKKYYPAMPYVTLGCILGLEVLLLFL